MPVGPVNNQVNAGAPAQPPRSAEAPLPGSGRNVPVRTQDTAGTGNNLPQAAEERAHAPEMPDVEAAVAQIQKYIESSGRELHFSVEEETGRTVIRVMDPHTGELIRAIPPEEVLAVASMLRSGNPGLFNTVV
ncbi:MAG: flagellar protein FlaG [Gammaproteobacteria bacterium]